MATDAGAIKYTVEAETGDLLNAEKVVDKSTTKIAKDFEKIDNANKKTTNEVKKTTKAVDQALITQTKAAERAAIAAEKAAERKAIAAEKAATKESAAAKKAAIAVQAASDKATRAAVASQKRQTAATQKEYAKRGRSVGQIGVQVQQLVGQIQGGQNVSQAFAAQLADIGIVAGLPLVGVLGALGFAIAGPLVDSLGFGASATEKLDKAIEDLDKTVQDTNGVKTFTKEIASLAKESEAAATLMVMAAQNSAKEAGKAAAIGIGESFNDSFDVAFFQKSFDALKSIAGTAGGTGYSISKEYRELGEQFGFTGEKAREVGTQVLISLRDMQQAVNADMPDAGAKILAFQNKLSELAETSSGKNKKKLLEFVTSINDYILKAKKAAEMSAFLKDQLKGTGEALPTDETVKQKTAIEGLISSLDAQIISLEKGEEAAFRYATAQQLGLKSGEQFTAEVDQKISDIFRLKAAQDDAKEQEKGVKLSEGVIAKGMTADQRFEETLTKLEFLRDTDITNRDIHEKAITELERKHAEERQKIKDGLAGRVSGLGLTQDESVAAKLASDLELLRQAEEQKIAIVGTYEDRRIELRRAAEEKIAGINKKGTDDAILNFEALETQAIGTFAGIATGAMDGKDAVRSLAQSILTQMVGALIKMGIQAAIGQTTVAATGVATAATLSAAYATPAALVSLATSGANAPLAAAGISSTVALSQGLSIAGGRQFGGPTTQGNNYRVNEGGVPEVLSSGGKDYLMNSPNGNVKQLDEISGGGGVTVNINNMAAGVDVQATPSDDGKTIEIAVRRAVAEMTNQVATGNGSFIRALKSGTNVTTKAGR